jgi:two-component system chemotaxis response regulator CheY
MATDPSLPILVVDDLGAMIRILRRTLRQLGFRNIDDASSTRDALDLLRAGTYGLLICDGNMHPEDVGDLLGEVSSDPALRATPVILVTAAGGAETGPVQAAVSVTVVKPIDARILMRAIDAALSGVPARRATSPRPAAYHHTSSA